MSLDEYESEHKPMQVDKVEYLDCINKVIHGDCLEIMPKIKPKSVDMILTDLPYAKTEAGWDSLIDINQMWQNFNNLLKQYRSIVLTSMQPFTSKLIMSNSDKFKFDYVWVKNRTTNFMTVKRQPLRKKEDVLVFSDGICTSVKKGSVAEKRYMPYYPQGIKLVNVEKHNYKNRRGRIDNVSNRSENDKVRGDGTYIQEYTNYPTNVLNFDLETTYLHPTQKPVELFEYLIKTYSNEGDTILDCCAGSGTTGIACKNTGRNYICIEKEKEYIDVMVERGLDLYVQ